MTPLTYARRGQHEQSVHSRFPLKIKVLLCQWCARSSMQILAECFSYKGVNTYVLWSILYKLNRLTPHLVSCHFGTL